MSDVRQPIRSTKEDDPDLEEAVSAFVIRLAERVDELQDAESLGQLDTLGALASALADDADRHGYPPLRDVATRVCEACALDKPEDAQSGLVELTEIGRRIRLGHRGAA